MVDYALRRRFSFYGVKPGFKTEGFKKYMNGLDNPKFERVVNCIESLNDAIASYESLGEAFYT